MPLFDPPLFGGRSERERKRERIRRNRWKGKAAEDQVAMELRMEGYEVHRVHEGADFRAIRRDPFTGKIVEDKLVEVKSGNAQLSERQRDEKRRSDDYEVRRREPLFY